MYREGAGNSDSPRAEVAAQKLDERGRRMLAAMDAIAVQRGLELATLGEARVAAQPAVIAPIASARTPKQLASLMAHVDLALTKEDLSDLNRASA